MARAAADHCMFCAPEPCVCNSKPKRTGKRLPSVPTKLGTVVELPVEDVTPQSATSRLERMRAKAAEDAARLPVPGPVVTRSPQPRSRANRHNEEPEKFDADKVKARIVSTLDEETVVLHGAIRALAPLLGDAQRREYDDVLSTEPSLDEQKLLWKARHRDHQAAASS